MREKANQELRKYIKQKAVFMWEIADAMGVSYDTLIRRIRHELNEEQMKEYKKVIDEIAKR